MDSNLGRILSDQAIEEIENFEDSDPTYPILSYHPSPVSQKLLV